MVELLDNSHYWYKRGEAVGVVLPQEGGGGDEVPWVYCRREEALPRLHDAAAGGKWRSQSHMEVRDSFKRCAYLNN